MQAEAEKPSKNIPYDISDFIRSDEGALEMSFENRETAEEILAALTATRDVKSQDMFLLNVLGKSLTDIGKQYCMSPQAVAHSIQVTKDKIRKVLNLIDSNKKFPRRVKYESGSAYRKAFAKYLSQRIKKCKDSGESEYIKMFEKLIMGC